MVSVPTTRTGGAAVFRLQMKTNGSAAVFAEELLFFPGLNVGVDAPDEVPESLYPPG